MFNIARPTAHFELEFRDRIGNAFLHVPLAPWWGNAIMLKGVTHARSRIGVIMLNWLEQPTHVKPLVSPQAVNLTAAAK